MEEEVKPKAEEPTIFQRMRGAPITFAIAAINVAVYLWAEQSGGTKDPGTQLQFGAAEPIHVWAGEYWRVATCMFMHFGFMHIAMNTYVSIGWATALERALGKTRFLALYLLAGIGGGCASMASTLISGSHVSAGASGALFGIIGATLALRRRQLPSWKAFVSDGAIRSTLIQIGLWTLIGTTALHLDNAAHFGGFAVGASMGWLFSTRARRVGWGAFAVTFAALFVLAARPWWTPEGKDANRLLAYASAYATGQVLIEGGTTYPWPKNVPRAVRLLEKGCSRGMAAACTDLEQLR